MVKPIGEVSGRWKCKHEHCGVCGACFLNYDQLHRCNMNTMSDEIKAVYKSDTEPKDVKV